MNQYKLELGRFYGDSNPEVWVFQAERYFNFYGFSKDSWLSMPYVYFKGEARAWFDWLYRNNQFYDWEHFKEKLAIHYQDQTITNSMEHPKLKLDIKEQCFEILRHLEDLRDALAACTSKSTVTSTSDDTREAEGVADSTHESEVANQIATEFEKFPQQGHTDFVKAIDSFKPTEIQVFNGNPQEDSSNKSSSIAPIVVISLDFEKNCVNFIAHKLFDELSASKLYEEIHMPACNIVCAQNVLGLCYWVDTGQNENAYEPSFIVNRPGEFTVMIGSKDCPVMVVAYYFDPTINDPCLLTKSPIHPRDNQLLVSSCAPSLVLYVWDPGINFNNFTPNHYIEYVTSHFLTQVRNPRKQWGPSKLLEQFMENSIVFSLDSANVPVEANHLVNDINKEFRRKFLSAIWTAREGVMVPVLFPENISFRNFMIFNNISGIAGSSLGSLLYGQIETVGVLSSKTSQLSNLSHELAFLVNNEEWKSKVRKKFFELTTSTTVINNIVVLFWENHLIILDHYLVVDIITKPLYLLANIIEQKGGKKFTRFDIDLIISVVCWSTFSSFEINFAERRFIVAANKGVPYLCLREVDVAEKVCEYGPTFGGILSRVKNVRQLYIKDTEATLLVLDFLVASKHEIQISFLVVFLLQLQGESVVLLEFHLDDTSWIKGRELFREISFPFPLSGTQFDSHWIIFASQEFVMMRKIASLDTTHPFDPGLLNNCQKVPLPITFTVMDKISLFSLGLSWDPGDEELLGEVIWSSWLFLTIITMTFRQQDLMVLKKCSAVLVYNVTLEEDKVVPLNANILRIKLTRLSDAKVLLVVGVYARVAEKHISVGDWLLVDPQTYHQQLLMRLECCPGVVIQAFGPFQMLKHMAAMENKLALPEAVRIYHVLCVAITSCNDMMTYHHQTMSLPNEQIAPLQNLEDKVLNSGEGNVMDHTKDWAAQASNKEVGPRGRKPNSLLADYVWEPP